MNIKQINEEVFIAEDRIVRVGHQDIEFFKEKSKHNQRKRIRLCAHRDVEDKVHEMLIIHTRDTYVRPHKHLNKSESFHIIEGSANVVIFDDDGNITEVIQMGDYSSGHKFYYRISDPYYHTLNITSELLVFHETTKGPFRRADTIVAPWSPEEGDGAAVKQFMEQLTKSVESGNPKRKTRLTIREG